MSKQSKANTTEITELWLQVKSIKRTLEMFRVDLNRLRELVDPQVRATPLARARAAAALETAVDGVVAGDGHALATSPWPLSASVALERELRVHGPGDHLERVQAANAAAARAFGQPKDAA
jgi:hypothetical protein